MNNEKKDASRSAIPNSAFDIEYRTQWRDEVNFLESRGIYYTIRKVEGEYNIPTYKYTRTAELFLALADFYLHRFPNRRSQATYTGRKPKFEQQSFLNKDGSIKKSFEVEKADVKPNVVLDLDKIKEAQDLLKKVADQIGEEKLSRISSDKENEKIEDDTE